MNLGKQIRRIIGNALGNPTGDMGDVTQSDDAALAAFVKRFKEHYRAHDQTRICFVIPGVALDAPNTAIKDELDKISTVSILTEAGCADSREDWNVYDMVVVGTDSTTAFTAIANIDILITIKLPVMVCCSSAAEELKMGTAVVGGSDLDLDEWCESVANRVMYKVFTTTGEKVLFSENTDSDRLDMSVGALIEQVLMLNATGDGPGLVVVGWLPMETALGITNKLNDNSDIPAGRVFAGCFYKADKLTDLGKELLRALCRNATQASITPSISLKAQAALVAAIHNDTNQMQGDWAALLVSIASILLDTETTIPDTITTIDTEVGNIEGKLDGASGLAAIIAALVALDGVVDTHDFDIKALLTIIDNEIAAVEAKLDGVSGLAAIIAAVAALDGVLDTHDTDIKALLTIITNHLDSEIADILADTGTIAWGDITAIDGIVDDIKALLVDGGTIDQLLDDIKALLVDGGVIDQLLDDILADTAALELASAKQLFTMDFWSDPQEEVQLALIAASPVFTPTVTIAALPGTIVRAVAMFKFRMVENTYDANSLDGATNPGTSQVIQIKEAGGAYIDAINFVDLQFSLAATTREGGDVLIGSINIVGEVDINGVYTFRWLLGKAVGDFIRFNDCAVGIRIWYSI